MPWLLFCIYVMLRDGVSEAARNGVGATLLMSWPTILAFVCGLYSLRVGGIAFRNLAGVIGLILSSVPIMFCVVGMIENHFHI